MSKLFAMLALVWLAACATAPVDPMRVYYDNTVLVTQPSGETDHLLLTADHTYTMYGIRFPQGRGHWDVENGQVCLMPGDTPETAGQKFCDAWAGAHVGDRWTIAVAGYSIPMEIAPGRLGPLSQ